MASAMPYRQVDELPGLPYVWHPHPTGGARRLSPVMLSGGAHELSRADRCVVLWLVPSNAIRDQTLKALRDRRHPYRQTLEAAFGSVAVMDISEALYVSRPTLEAETAIIVSTLQAFRVEDPEGRKVYESSGALMGPFCRLAGRGYTQLTRRDDGAVIPSLTTCFAPAPACRRGGRSAQCCARRFHSKCWQALTQPALSSSPPRRTRKKPQQMFAQRLGRQLQAEDMIKMPIRPRPAPTGKRSWPMPSPRSVSCGMRRVERQETSEYLRPIMQSRLSPSTRIAKRLRYDAVKRV